MCKIFEVMVYVSTSLIPKYELKIIAVYIKIERHFLRE